MDCIVSHSLKPFCFVLVWFVFKAKSLSIIWFALLELLSLLEDNLDSWFYFRGNRDQPNTRLDIKCCPLPFFAGIFCNIINVLSCAGLSLKHRVMCFFFFFLKIFRKICLCAWQLLRQKTDKNKGGLSVLLFLSCFRLKAVEMMKNKQH